LNASIALWTRLESASVPVSAGELDRAEERLQTRLPADYRSAVLQFGLPRPTFELLNAIVDRQLDLGDVSDFLSPTEMVSVTEEWRDLGLPEELVAFATDCMGNLYCFPKPDEPGGSTPIFFFDHDSRALDVVAPSFTRWIEDFCAVAPH
jgi:cell wall assembly regulator SMI1